MAEVQNSSESGQMAQQFIEMVMMQAQNAAYALGQIPHPDTGEAPVNLELARIFIDQLIVLRAKTRGNLSNEELAVLNNAISNLQMVFVEVSKGGPQGAAEEMGDEEESPAPAQDSPRAEVNPAAPVEEPAPEESSRKKFTKSYGS
jgi:hypothetical protein